MDLLERLEDEGNSSTDSNDRGGLSSISTLLTKDFRSVPGCVDVQEWVQRCKTEDEEKQRTADAEIVEKVKRLEHCVSRITGGEIVPFFWFLFLLANRPLFLSGIIYLDFFFSATLSGIGVEDRVMIMDVAIEIQECFRDRTACSALRDAKTRGRLICSAMLGEKLDGVEQRAMSEMESIQNRRAAGTAGGGGSNNVTNALKRPPILRQDVEATAAGYIQAETLRRMFTNLNFFSNSLVGQVLCQGRKRGHAREEEEDDDEGAARRQTKKVTSKP